MEVPETTVNEEAATPLKLTPVTSKKLVPAMVTEVPTVPVDGVMDVMVGAAYLKYAPLEVPAEVVTVILPEVLTGASTVMEVPETTVNEEAATPLKLTPVTSKKLVPVMVTEVPTVPVDGLMNVIIGVCE